MAGNVRHEGQNTSRGRSPALWNNCPVRAIKHDFHRGWYAEDDFMGDHDLTTRYTLTQATQGTFALIDGTTNHTQGGIADLDSNSTTVAQGGNVQFCGASTGLRFFPQAGDTIWFEARIAVSDMTAGTTGPELFVGLSEIDDSIIASSAISSANHIGYGSVTDDGILLGNSEKAGTAHTGVSLLELGTAAAGIANASWHKVGFKVNGITSVEWWVDGVYKSNKNVATANVPIVGMVPSFVCHSDGTVDPILHIDWWSCYQEHLT